MRWISVKDELPKPNTQQTMFIVCTEHGVGVARYEYDFGEVLFDGNTQFHGDKVTHWMPMPSKAYEK
ncbi:MULTISPECIES: DUF551 domain-containing protein [Providencia]|uniref:DUF551 domain-containing protein n=1 Tax=Providencia TaxID=586 RepID=UPI0019D05AE0|nr:MULTISPECIES: DUF551 domain-containing protein [Providencia]ELR5271149.1 DUF551 domain-containing protein [Providencia rettgeri]EMD0753813.1 DUF551 domain-containing protein [Providencia rettgeri]MBN6364300.1 DUF551 domain-containing protein [Providencia rettgeri]MDH2321600.1 DUF551 domain-containing protein [Providencia rettgeri]WOC05464.1 DUF551 domain-containing protein [Providencia sp. PROV024]